MAGKLTFLTIPIGNLSDLTKRVETSLREGKYFVVEDSRVFLSLLSALGISHQEKQWSIWHDHSTDHDTKKIEQWLSANENVFVVSDAGSPVLSDPGYELLKRLNPLSFELDSFGGVNAVMTALELSRFTPIPFHFHGFLARASQDIKKQILPILTLRGTHLFFLSPHRVHETVDSILESVSDSQDIQFCLARELTKMFQEVTHFNHQTWSKVKETLQVKGEFVFLMQVNQSMEPLLDVDKMKTMAREYLENPRPKILAKLLSEILDEETSTLYDKMIQKSSK